MNPRTMQPLENQIGTEQIDSDFKNDLAKLVAKRVLYSIAADPHWKRNDFPERIAVCRTGSEELIGLPSECRSAGWYFCSSLPAAKEL